MMRVSLGHREQNHKDCNVSPLIRICPTCHQIGVCEIPEVSLYRQQVDQRRQLWSGSIVTPLEKRYESHGRNSTRVEN